MKGASIYSKACKPVKIIANNKVTKVPIIAPFLSPLITAWCAQVIKAPEDNNNIVLSKGIAGKYTNLWKISSIFIHTCFYGFKFFKTLNS